MSQRLQRFLIPVGAAALLIAACDPNVVIGARKRLTEGGFGGQVASGGTQTAGVGGAGTGGAPGGSSAGGSEAVAGAAGDGDAGAGGAGGAPPLKVEWCATAPWVNNPVKFTSDEGNIMPAGKYIITYVSGAQIHDVSIGYEVTRHYYIKETIEAGHHFFSGESPETGATSLWLDEVGIVGAGGTIAQVEAANRGHTWPLTHAGGELYVTLYDDDYHDNVGPGSRFCISAAPP